ncbi:MAG: hypothetical protein NTU84_00510 [Verrucomicrobia bacterium]|nr:hypothetical protein [Verrucomicrobiota bacterium]
MNLLKALALPALLLVSLWDICMADAVRTKPNILFLLTDDQRWDTLGCMGPAPIHVRAERRT